MRARPRGCRLPSFCLRPDPPCAAGRPPSAQPARLTLMPGRDHRRRAPSRRRSVLLLALFGAALALLLVLLFTVGPFASHLQRPGKPPLGYLRQPLGGRHYRVAAWTLGNTTSLTTALAAGSVDEVDFDWY